MQQGEDSLLTIPLLDGGTPVTVGPAVAGLVSNIQANVFVGAEKVGQYSLNAQAGFGDLAIHDTINHAIVIRLERSQTKTFPVGLLRIATVVTFVDNDFPNGRNVEVAATIGRITKGETLDLLP